MDVVEAILPTPITINLFHIGQSIPHGPRTFGTKTAKPCKVKYWINGIENQAKSGRSWPCGPP